MARDGQPAATELSTTPQPVSGPVGVIFPPVPRAMPNWGLVANTVAVALLATAVLFVWAEPLSRGDLADVVWRVPLAVPVALGMAQVIAVAWRSPRWARVAGALHALFMVASAVLFLPMALAVVFGHWIVLVPAGLAVYFAASVLQLDAWADALARDAHGRCPRCGYDTRVTAGDCPECGTGRYEVKSLSHRGIGNDE